MKLRTFLITPTTIFSLIAVGCSGAQGTRPHDMSAEEHQAAAQSEEQAASGHESEYEPAAQSEEEECDLTSSDAYGLPICWTDTVNPTEKHLKMAKKHRELAQKHRDASAELRRAEERECQGVSEADRSLSPFGHPEDIISVSRVEPIQQHEGQDADPGIGGGARVTFTARPRLTLERLQRLVACHEARNAALGHEAPEMPYCLLVPDKIQTEVSSTNGGFVVQVTSRNPAIAEDLWQRAQKIK